jgi:hypothetical protein
MYFFILVSVMVRLDSATLERSIKRFIGVAEGICAITLNKNESIICQHAQEISHPFLAVRKCKTAITPAAINISLDDTILAWSPNLHLRLLQLWIESTDFRIIAFEKNIVSNLNGININNRKIKIFTNIITNHIFFINLLCI